MPVDIEQWHAEIGTFPWCNYEIRTKLAQHHFKSKPKASSVFQYYFSTFLMWTLLFIFWQYFLYLLCRLLSWNSQFTIFFCFNFSQHIYNQISIFCCINTIEIFNVLYSDYFLHLLLLQHVDIESNLEPKKEQIKYIPCCHWNFNSLLVQNMCKISQTETYSSLYNYDFICISETYFNSSILEEDFQLNGYQLIRADHTSNTNRGGVCISTSPSSNIIKPQSMYCLLSFLAKL